MVIGLLIPVAWRKHPLFGQITELIALVVAGVRDGGLIMFTNKSHSVFVIFKISGANKWNLGASQRRNLLLFFLALEKFSNCGAFACIC